jgi:two-component system response regulator NreC
MSIRVLIADDHKIIRQGLRSLLEKQPDIEVVGEAEDGQMAVRLVKEKSPGVVIMDVAMPNLNGIEATRKITAQKRSIKVIALSIYSDNRFVTGMLGAGASGYLLKDCAFEELIEAIYTVATDHTYLSPSIADIVVKNYVRLSQKTDCSVHSTLTNREREVLQRLGEGGSTKEIAQRMRLSVKTIETYRMQIMGKLNIHNVAELTKYAIREGLTSLQT